MKTHRQRFGMLLCSLSLFAISCQKEIKEPAKLNAVSINKGDHGGLQQTKTYSDDVVISWLDMQLKMLQVPLAPGATSQDAARALAYCGIAAYESVVPGMPAYKSLNGQLTGFSGVRLTEPGKAYHWAAVANAALADMNRALFPGASGPNKASVDSLESALEDAYTAEADSVTIQRSVAFGKAVALFVSTWAATDGSAFNPPYVPTPGEGIWVPTSLG